MKLLVGEIGLCPWNEGVIIVAIIALGATPELDDAGNEADIAVIWVDLDSSVFDQEAHRSALNEREFSRAREYKDPILQRRYLASRVALRLALGKFRGEVPNSFRFELSEWGKPFLRTGPYFNLSHSGSVCIIAIDALAPIGVDLEKADAASSISRPESILSDAELAGGLIIDDKSLVTRGWVRKEAVLKALGCGLSINPRTLSVGIHCSDFSTWRSISVAMPNGRGGCSFIDLPCNTDFVAALSTAGRVPRLIVTSWFDGD